MPKMLQQMNNVTRHTIRRAFLFLSCGMPFLFCLFTDWEIPYLPGISADQMQAYSYQTVLNTIETGDILITFDSHFLSWRNGHAALVINAEEGTLLEAKCPGQNSGICNISRWETYHSFAVLRPKGLSSSERTAVAAYAERELNNLPYSLFPALTSSSTSPASTHCAHLIWYSYQLTGYNLDSDGGIFITPRDLYDSSTNLHLIAAYDTTR